MPRAGPSVDDSTALVFLDTAAELIDAALAERRPDDVARVRSLKFPPALDWIRLEDVIALARARERQPAVSKKAFQNRWPSKDAFIRDAILHTLLYRDKPGTDPRTPDLAGRFFDFGIGTLSGEVLATADSLYRGLLDHPRSYLLAHIGPTLSQWPQLQAEVQAVARESLTNWAAGYTRILRRTGLSFRPGWTSERLGLALQALLDGFVLRTRVNPREVAAASYAGASLFADTVLALVSAVLDVDHSGLSVRDGMNRAVPELEADASL